MSPPLTYGPAYLGIYAALVLGIACNAFLDIRYGSFGFEVFFWAGVFAYTLRVGWKQEGRVGELGQSRQKIVLLVGGALSVLVFLPMWGLPPALQAAMNCVTVTRRNLHFGLLVSLIMVMFAATHARADWTMLFYLLPYIVAVVFTLVSEQIARRARDIRREGLGLASAGGQGAAIAAATATILVLGGLLYAATPQMSITHLYWKYGQPGRMGQVGGTLEAGGGAGSGQSASSGVAGQANGDAGGAAGQAAFSGLPTVAQMREAAGRPGMPRWQSSAITTLADIVEGTAEVLRPIDLGFDELIEDIKQWLKEHRAELLSALLALVMVALAVAAWLLLREARLGLWFAAYFDYLRFGILRAHAPGKRGARQYYHAMERLFELHGLARPAAANTREYLRLLARRFDHLRHEASEATLIFERARYSRADPDPAELARMRALYRRMFSQASQLSASD